MNPQESKLSIATNICTILETFDALGDDQVMKRHISNSLKSRPVALRILTEAIELRRHTSIGETNVKTNEITFKKRKPTLMQLCFRSTYRKEGLGRLQKLYSNSIR